MPLPPELQRLMSRYCQLAQLLPAVDDFDATDSQMLTSARVTLTEMAAVKAEIDEFLATPGAAGSVCAPQRTSGGSRRNQSHG